MSTPHRLPPELREGTHVLPRAKTSAFTTAPKPQPGAGQQAWRLRKVEQAAAFLVPENVLGEMEKWAMKATDERQRCGRLEAVVWWRRWVRLAEGRLEQR